MGDDKMNQTYFSGDYYLTISNEPPMTNNGKILCKFDLINNRFSLYGAPVNQFGSIEEVITILKAWREIANKPEFRCIYELNWKKRKMEDEFISILEKEEFYGKN